MTDAATLGRQHRVQLSNWMTAAGLAMPLIVVAQPAAPWPAAAPLTPARLGDLG
jgi:hypothetical protein